MLRKNLSHLPAAFVLALLVLLIGPIPAGASPTMPVGLLTPGLHGAKGAPAVPPISGAHGPAAPVPTMACSSWTQVKSPSPSSIQNVLLGVVAPTTSFAWAAGFDDSIAGSQTLIVQWNGTSWNQVASPNPARLNFLYSVTGNAQNAWAVGYSANNLAVDSTLILQWNGSSWRAVPSPNPQLTNFLYGVAGDAQNAWAVGESQDPSPNNQTLTEQWNGSSWNVVPSPNPPAVNFLMGVAQIGNNSGHFWAVGYSGTDTLILQC